MKDYSEIGITYEDGVPAALVDHGAVARFGLWIGIISLSMLFLGFLGAFVVVRAGPERWPPEGVELNLMLGAANTAVIVLSSVALAAGLAHARRRDGKAGFWLAAGGALALAFLGLQLVQYRSLLVNYRQSISSSQFGTYFYSLTALHGLHLIVGVVWLGCLLASRGRRSPLLVELCGTYWHFVTVLWILLFTVLYLV